MVAPLNLQRLAQDRSLFDSFRTLHQPGGLAPDPSWELVSGSPCQTLQVVREQLGHCCDHSSASSCAQNLVTAVCASSRACGHSAALPCKPDARAGAGPKHVCFGASAATIQSGSPQPGLTMVESRIADEPIRVLDLHKPDDHCSYQELPTAKR